MDKIVARIHRTSPTNVDLDYQVNDGLTITTRHADHAEAAERKRLFDNLPNREEQEEALRTLLFPSLGSI